MASSNSDFDSILFESMRTDSFDSVAWVNRLIEATAANGNDEDEALLNTVRMATTRLQTRSQELSRDAERLMERMLNAGPRATQELDRVERDALSLRQDLRRLQEESKTNGEEAVPFQTLKSLDMIKSNLEGCVKVLQETGSWNALVRDMDAHFAARNLVEVAAKLTIMRETIATLANFPDAPKRMDMLERMEQRLEALVRPGLQNALEQLLDGNKEPLKQSVTVFESLGQRPALLAIVGQVRGEFVYETALKEEHSAPSPDKKTAYSRFVDRVFALLRDGEAPLCLYCFENPEARSEALAHIVLHCFERLSSKSILETFIKQGSHVDAAGCDRYGHARQAMIRLKRDVLLALFGGLPQSSEIRNQALDAIEKPFVDLDQKYLEWETNALKSELKSWLDRKTAEGDVSGLDDILAKPGKAESDWDRTLSRLRIVDDALESLCDECSIRCDRVTMSAVVPIALVFQAQAEETLKIVTPVQTKPPAAATKGKPAAASISTPPTPKISDEENTMRSIVLLKTCTDLKDRFESTVKRASLKRASSSSGPADVQSSPRAGVDAIAESGEPELKALESARGSLRRLVAEAQMRLYKCLINPALMLLDRGIEQSTSVSANTTAPMQPSDAVTKAIDYLYSLIGLLDWEAPSADMVATFVEPLEERVQLEGLVHGTIPYGSPAETSSLQDLPRAISASWLEAVCRGLSTGFVLRVLKLKKVNDATASQLGMDADFLEKNAGSVLAQGVLWDPALGVCRVVMSAGPGLTHLKLGKPKEHLDERYYIEGPSEPLKTLEHQLVALRNRS